PLVYAANLLVKLNRVEEALDYLTRAEAIDPQSSEIRLSRGRALEKLGRFAEAEKEYQEAGSTDGSGQARAALDRLRAAASGNRGRAKQASSVAPIRFRNVAEQARLDFVLRNDASPRKYQVETMTGGLAALDYDNDGWPDIYFVNGAELPAMKKSSPGFWNRLYRNNRDGTFNDVTEKAGVKGEGYSMGAAVADYDNDGDQDLFVAGVNRNILFRNDGNGRFEDVTEKAGLSGVDPNLGKAWSVAAAWLDYNNDGHLDPSVV